MCLETKRHPKECLFAAVPCNSILVYIIWTSSKVIGKRTRSRILLHLVCVCVCACACVHVCMCAENNELANPLLFTKLRRTASYYLPSSFFHPPYPSALSDQHADHIQCCQCAVYTETHLRVSMHFLVPLIIWSDGEFNLKCGPTRQRKNSAKNLFPPMYDL